MKHKKRNKIIYWLFILLFIVGVFFIYVVYSYVYKSNVNLNGKREIVFYIRTGWNYEHVINSLKENDILINYNTFDFISEIKGYKNSVKPGRYIIYDKMNNNNLVNMLRSGRQKPVKLVLNNIRKKVDLARRISHIIEADSSSIMELLYDSIFISKDGFDTNTVMCAFIPNTYEMYWNTSAEQMFNKIYDYYKKFWNDYRLEKCRNMGMKPEEVIILASIVYSETKAKDEMGTIAGVYLNRLKKGMLLQADPTVVYSIGDFSIRRVTGKHLKTESPYNTYINYGLPPGPICLPEPYVIDSVLNYKKHKYLYFCAKEDFSGLHNFAENEDEHMKNARRYHLELRKRNILMN